ncbi:MAG TPA: hypothetical protein VF676_03245 [Flavobacterium sp.]|jgi:hypothetical protein
MEDTIIKFILGTVFGGLFTGIISAKFDKKKNKYTTKHTFKEQKYKSITVLMYSLVNYEAEQLKLLKIRPDLKTKGDLVDELKMEWTNMALYTNDTVLLATKKFLKDPIQQNFNSALLAMRSNLYDINTKLTPAHLDLNSEEGSR